MQKVHLIFAVLSFLEVGPLLLKLPGVKFLLSEKFSQDPLEAYFGKQRYQGGSNSNPSVNEYYNNATNIMVQGSAALDPVRGNSRRSRKRKATTVDNTPMPKRRVPRKKLPY